MMDINNHKIADLQPMPSTGGQAHYGIGIIPLLRIDLNADGLLDYFSNGHSAWHGILNAGLEGSLAPSWKRFAEDVPLPRTRTAADIAAILARQEPSELKSLMADGVKMFGARNAGTQRSSFASFQRLAQDFVDLSKTRMFLTLPARPVDRSQVVTWVKQCGPSEMRPLIRTLFDWFLPFCGSPSMQGVRFTYSDTAFNIEPCASSAHELMESATRAKAFLSEAAPELALDVKKLSKIEKRLRLR